MRLSIWIIQQLRQGLHSVHSWHLLRFKAISVTVQHSLAKLVDVLSVREILASNVQRFFKGFPAGEARQWLKKPTSLSCSKSCFEKVSTEFVEVVKSCGKTTVFVIGASCDMCFIGDLLERF